MDTPKEGGTLDLLGIAGMGLVVLLVGIILGIGIGVWKSDAILQRDPSDARVEFYRGAWTACVSFTEEVFGLPPDTATGFCNETVVKFAAARWYETQSVEYVPPPELGDLSVPNAPPAPE